MQRNYHFIKPDEANQNILTNPAFLFQRKFDGISSEVFSDEDVSIIGRGILKGRNSDLTEKFPELVKAIKEANFPRGTMFLPEIVVFNPDGSENFSAILTRSHRENQIELFSRLHPATMVIHDVVSIGGNDLTHDHYLSRLNAIMPFIQTNSRLSVIINSHNGVELWNHISGAGLEGIIARNPLSPLGEHVFKLKRSFTEEVFCTGTYEPSTSNTRANMEYLVEGKKKKGVFANLTCYQLTSKNDIIRVCDVGTGFSVDEMKEIQAMLDLGKITPRTPLVLEVEANARSNLLALRHPRFIRLRPDKPWNECLIKNVR